MNSALPLRRAPAVRIYDVLACTVVVTPEGGRHEFADDSAVFVRAVLALLERPHTREELRREVEALAGGPLPRPEVLEELLALLLQARAIEVAGSVPRPRAGARVLLGITGAVASMHAPALVQLLQARGFEVRVVATEQALRFVRSEALEALTHRPVVHGMWPVDELHRVPHIELAAWADVVVVAPASATTVARIAAGDFSSVVSAVVLATQAPVLLVPSMNPAMYASPPVQRNLGQLVADGMHVAHPAYGPEVADRPGERTPVLGGAPPPEVVASLISAVLRARATAPRSAGDWDRLYRCSAADELPWQRDEADADLLAALGEATSVLEVGAGLGSLAVAAAGRGHRVVATDLSGVALEQARARAPTAAVTWVQDDITDSRLHSRFARVVDRGCLHLLRAEEVPRYVASVARLCEPGGLVIVKALSEPAEGVTIYSASTIAAAFAPDFILEQEVASGLPGPRSMPAARVYILRRAPRSR